MPADAAPLHPWYVSVLVPLCALRPATPWWSLVASIGFYLLYFPAIHRAGEWVDTPWVRALVFGPVLLVWGWWLCRMGQWR